MHTIWSEKCLSKFSLSCPVCQLNCLRTRNKLSLGGWYVANVSTFPNTFLAVSPLICMIWIKLTRTNNVFSKTTLWCLFLCRNQLSQKILKISLKLYFHGRLPEPEGQLEGGHQARRGVPGAPPGHVWWAPGTWDHPSNPPLVFRPLRRRNGEPPKDFPKYDPQLRRHPNP